MSNSSSQTLSCSISKVGNWGQEFPWNPKPGSISGLHWGLTWGTVKLRIETDLFIFLGLHNFTLFFFLSLDASVSFLFETRLTSFAASFFHWLGKIYLLVPVSYSDWWNFTITLHFWEEIFWCSLSWVSIPDPISYDQSNNINNMAAYFSSF